MGFAKFKRPIMALGEGDQTERISSTAQKISAFGTSILGITASTADKVVLIARPPVAGLYKYLICKSTGVQKLTVTVDGTTTTNFFEGTTFRSIAFSSKSTQQRTAALVSWTTGGTPAWAVISKSTGATLAG